MAVLDARSDAPRESRDEIDNKVHLYVTQLGAVGEAECDQARAAALAMIRHDRGILSDDADSLADYLAVKTGFDRGRSRAVEDLAKRLPGEPLHCSSELRATPRGIEYMIMQVYGLLIQARVHGFLYPYQCVLALNLVAEKRFGANWKFGPDWTRQARLIVDEAGVHTKKAEGEKPSAKP